MNRTVKGAKNVHGKDPQLLIEKITRERIFESIYWKENCFGLDTEGLMVLAAKLDHVGGTFSNQKPTPFLCLTLRLLQLQPEEDVLLEFISQEDFKYLRVLGLFYWRLVATPATRVYQVLEAYLRDRRKIRVRHTDGTYDLTHVDEIVDRLLRDDRVFCVILPRLQSRMQLEELEELALREPLISDFEDEHLDGLEDTTSKPEMETEPINAPLGTGDQNELSIDQTNALRAQLGLKPLA